MVLSCRAAFAQRIVTRAVMAIINAAQGLIAHLLSSMIFLAVKFCLALQGIVGCDAHHGSIRPPAADSSAI
jgi:hypothetical protein